MITENLSTLKIHKLTQEQYNRELAEGNIDENAIYLTPTEDIDTSLFATKEELEGKSDKGHTHEIADIANLQLELEDFVTMQEVEDAINNSTPTIEVDSTLSIEGMAADAKATGDALDEKVSMYVNEEADAELPDGYDIYIDTTDGTSQIPMIPGIVYATASQILPEGFLWCNGAAVSRAEYSELFSAIGTAYGAGDGSTTFNVPDLQTRIPMGAGGEYGLGTMGGEAEHTLTEDELPNLTGGFKSRGWNGVYNLLSEASGIVSMTNEEGSAFGAASDSVSVGYRHFSIDFGGDQSHNNLQPYTVVNYIISTGKGAQINALDVVAGIQTLPLAAEYGGTGFNNLTSLGEALNATGTVGAFTFEKVDF